MTVKQFKAFNGKDFYHFEKDYTEQLKNEIKQSNKEYILGVDEEEYKSYQKSKYYLEPLKVMNESEIIHPPHPIKIEKHSLLDRGPIFIDGYQFNIEYTFTRAPLLFNLRPTTRTMIVNEITVDNHSYTVSFQFEVDNQDKKEFKRVKNETYKNSFSNVCYINNDAEKWNNNLDSLIETKFHSIKQNLLSENKFFEEIQVKVDSDTNTIFTAPTVRKVIIPRPIPKKKSTKGSPTINPEMYNDILKVLNEVGRSMERKPSTYKGKDEEGIRDHLLTFLETRYDATTATGETFNKSGKTDILLKYKDGTNLFVAECKWWKGSSEFHKAINQLFNNYLTWRDSKTALLIFVKNKEITPVITKIKDEAPNHQYFIKEMDTDNESSFSYIFHFPDDKDKLIQLEIMVFHFSDQ